MVLAVTNGKRESEVWPHRTRSITVQRHIVEAATQHALLLPGPWDRPRWLSPIAEHLQALGMSATLVELPIDDAITFADWIEIVVALCAHERARHAHRSLHLLGVGLGGCLGYWAAAAGAPVDSLIATALGDPRRDVLRRRILGARWPTPVTTLGMQWLTPVAGHRRWIPPGLLQRDTGITHEADTSALALPLTMTTSWLTTTPAFEPEAFTTCPVRLIAPTADRWLQLDASLDFYRLLSGEKRLIMLEGAGHLPVDPESAASLAQHVCQCAAYT